MSHPPRKLEPRNIEVMDDQMAAVLRAKTGAQRLQIADRMFAFARDHLAARLRQEHPDWPEQQVRREVARRLSHGAV
jgi:hypothetical protein